MTPIRRTLLVLFVLAFTVTNAVLAQVRVSALGKGNRPVQTSTNELVIVPYADQTVVGTPVVGKTTLSPGDQLVALADDLFVELRCPHGTTLRFTKRFRVLIGLAKGRLDCAVNLTAGGLDLFTNQQTEVNAGGRVLGTPGTTYALRLEGGENSPVMEHVLVFEGRLHVGNAIGERELAAGKAVSLQRRSNETSERPLTGSEIERWAQLYAQFDVIKAQQASGVELSAEERDSALDQLSSLHANVFRHPEERQPRLMLARTLATLRISDEAAFHLLRPGVLGQQTLRRYQSDLESLYERGDPERRPRLDALLHELEEGSP